MIQNIHTLYNNIKRSLPSRLVLLYVTATVVASYVLLGGALLLYGGRIP